MKNQLPIKPATDRTWTLRGTAWLILWLAAGSLLGWSALGKLATSHKSTAMATTTASFTSADAQNGHSSQRFATKPIEQIRVGERVVTELPDDLRDETYGSEEELPYWDHEQLVPDQWRKISLEMQLTADDRLDVVLLRPLRWLEENDCRTGNEIHLLMPELNVDGPAQVTAVASCPEIPTGQGTVVTGTFTHVRNGIVKLSFDGLSQPILATDNHRFFSVTHHDFVAAGDLAPGDEVQTLSGITRLIQNEALTTIERVYNLEVLHEHVFRVSKQGILVHNNYPEGPLAPSRSAAFRMAKRDALIPRGEHPTSVDHVPMTDAFGKSVIGSNGRPIMTRQYSFGKRGVVIQEHSAGHSFPGGGTVGPHFNVRPSGGLRHGIVPGTAPHYRF